MPLAITISTYGQGGAAPYLLSASYEVTGASGPLEVELTIDDAPAVRATAVSGTLTLTLPNPGTYRLGARVMNQGRSAKTGMPRLVTVTAAEPAPQPATSADALDVPLEGLTTLSKSNWTEILTRIVAAIREWAARANDGEPMTDEQLAATMYRVVVEASKWKTLRAALTNAWPAGDPSPGEMSRAVADVLVMAAYRELLFREPDPFGLDYYGSRLADGRMTDATMRSDIMESEEYRLLHVPVAPAPMAPLTLPVLSIVGRQFRNGNALYIPCWVSGLTLLVRTSADRIAFLDWARRTGFNGVRVFAGALTWAGQSPESARSALPALLEQAASRGLVVEVTAITDSATGYDAKAHLSAVAAILAGRRSVVLELANEIGHPTQSAAITAERLRQWGQAVAEPRGLLWALGAASTDEPIDNVYAASGGRYCTAHLDRGRPSWNNVRRVREIYAIVESHGVPAINNEPMGADELDGSQTDKQRWNDPALFFTLGALDRAFGVGGVHHSQAGLMAQVPGPVQQQCADAYVAGHAGVETVLPGVVGQYKNVGHAGGPFSGARFVEGGSADGVVRAYSFVDGARGVTVMVGARGDAGLVWTNGWRQVRELSRRTAMDGRYGAVLEIAR